MGNKQTGTVPTHSILINLCPPSHHTLSTIICIIHTLVVLGYITQLHSHSSSVCIFMNFPAKLNLYPLLLSAKM